MDEDALTPGLREELITVALQRQLEVVSAARVERRVLPASELEPLLLRHARAPSRSGSDRDGRGRARRDKELAEELGQELMERYELVLPPELLSGIRPEPVGLEKSAATRAPAGAAHGERTARNDRKQPSIGSQLKAELQSAEYVDLICAFVIWNGVVTLLDELRALVRRGGTTQGHHHHLRGSDRSKSGVQAQRGRGRRARRV